MVSEPTSSETEVETELNGEVEAEPENEPEQGKQSASLSDQQPRWMSITVVLAGFIGAIVMILLVRG